MFFFVLFEKKCYAHFKIISNLASQFIDTKNFTSHENNLLLWIFPLNDMQAPLPHHLKKFRKSLE